MHVTSFGIYMFAIVEIQGHQYKVEKGEKILVDQLNAKAGDTVEFDTVLLVDKDGKGKAEVGMPYVKAKVKAKVLDHNRGDKIRVFKMKAKKRYRKTFGHRSYFTELEIADIA